MIKIAGPYPRFEPVGSFSLVDGFGHLVDELVRRDTANPGHWKLKVCETPPMNVSVVGLFVPGVEKSQLTYYSQSLDWEKEILPLRLFVQTIDLIEDTSPGIEWVRDKRGSQGMFRRFLESMVSSVIDRRIDPNTLQDKTIRQLVAYCVGLMAHDMSIPQAHAFADEYK